MKIVCGSCQAKYSIADEKVAGKVFKIRCKRCSEVIVVRGDLDAQAETGNGMDAGNGAYPSNGSYDPSSVDAIWHVVVNGEQAGPYTPMQLSEMLSSGQLDWEAYVWSEGFENWVPMRDVPDLVAAISGQPAEEPAQAVAAPMRAVAQPSMGADPFADDGGPAVGMFAQPAAQAHARSNLFGEASSVSFDASPKVVASAPSPRVSADQAMTGVRNENSVLFSLKNLQALATGTSTPAAAPNAGGLSHRPGFAAGEGSGLIDIRALASATGVGDSGRGETEKDALLSLGSAQTGAFGALGSPMLAPSKSDDDGSKKGLAIAIVGGFALLAGSAIAIAVILKPGVSMQPPVVTPVVMQPTAALPPGSAPGVGMPGSGPTKPVSADPPSEGEIEAQRKAAQPPAASPGSDDRHHGTSPTKHGAAPAEKPAEPVAAAKPEPSKPAEKPKAKGGSSSIDDLLEGAIGSGAKGGGKSHEAAPAANLPDKPSRDDVLNAMNGVKDAVKACAKGAGGVAFANVTVIGKTGRVGNVEVTGITGEVGSCIARTVRKANFAKFKADDFQVKFPFRL